MAATPTTRGRIVVLVSWVIVCLFVTWSYLVFVQHSLVLLLFFFWCSTITIIIFSIYHLHLLLQIKVGVLVRLRDRVQIVDGESGEESQTFLILFSDRKGNPFKRCLYLQLFFLSFFGALSELLYSHHEQNSWYDEAWVCYVAKQCPDEGWQVQVDGLNDHVEHFGFPASKNKIK